ncbi:MAG: DNA translocase FtsK 4TM domain-containing protein, partial [bacterium]|nr:DNA translocase FtsK 4TM domain-containing protein [bacterium]
MARKKKRSSKKRKDSFMGLDLDPEVQRGILTIFIFALAALIFLSFFGIAGSLGTVINNALSSFFGLDRYILPVVLILIGATRAYPDRGTFSTWNYLGFLFFFLSFNALINLFLVNRADPVTTDLTMAGGYLGQFLATMLTAFVGYWGGVVTTASLLLVSVLLIFNTSLRSIFGVHTHLFGWIGERMHRGRYEEVEDDDYE